MPQVSQRGIPDAWDCISESDLVYDPCFENPFPAEADLPQVACFDSPFSTGVVLLTVIAPLDRDKVSDTTARQAASAQDTALEPWDLPWALELGNGEQCVAADTSVTCDYNAKTNDYRCCAYEGDGCGWAGGCCGWLRCSDAGVCTGQPPSGCDSAGCDCDFHDPNACAPGLVCCAVQSGFICATRENCGMG